jgi:hypothetical protein
VYQLTLPSVRAAAASATSGVCAQVGKLAHSIETKSAPDATANLVRARIVASPVRWDRNLPAAAEAAWSAAGHEKAISLPSGRRLLPRLIVAAALPVRAKRVIFAPGPVTLLAIINGAIVPGRTS